MEKKNPDRIYNQPNKNETNQMIQTIKSPRFQKHSFCKISFLHRSYKSQLLHNKYKEKKKKHTHRIEASRKMYRKRQRQREEENQMPETVQIRRERIRNKEETEEIKLRSLGGYRDRDTFSAFRFRH